MGSVPEARHKQAQEVWGLWKRLVREYPSSDQTYEEFQQYERDTLKKLAELCLPEICEAFQDVGLERFTETTTKIASAAIFRAVKTVTESKRPIHEHVKVCVREALEEYVGAFNEWFYKAEAEELLPLLLSLPRPTIARMAEYLSRQQRSGLRELVFRQLGGKPILLLRNREPKEQRRWLYWYLWYWEQTQPNEQGAPGEVPDVALVAHVDEIPTSKKTGEPLDPLGPIHAKVLQQLGPEINKHGTIKINYPHSKSRIARSQGVDRSTLDRYLKTPISREPKPDGKGRVTYTFTDEDMIRAMEEVLRKRGPRPSDY
jgi:hypothetical protein